MLERGSPVSDSNPHNDDKPRNHFTGDQSGIKDEVYQKSAAEG